jgi:molybdenum cofactor cytidylyltransferase
MPWIAPETIAAVARSLEAGASIVAPSYRGQRGHPVAFGAGYRAALLALDGDRGARELVQDAKSSLELVEVDDPGVLRDVDAPADLDSESRPS